MPSTLCNLSALLPALYFIHVHGFSFGLSVSRHVLRYLPFAQPDTTSRLLRLCEVCIFQFLIDLISTEYVHLLSDNSVLVLPHWRTACMPALVCSVSAYTLASSLQLHVFISRFCASASSHQPLTSVHPHLSVGVLLNNFEILFHLVQSIQYRNLLPETAACSVLY